MALWQKFNSQVIESPELIQDDPLEEGWLIKIETSDDVDDEDEDDDDEEDDEDEDEDHEDEDWSFFISTLFLNLGIHLACY